jgi:crotonobetainyl-CoA:carnitine CoA-transferase CaiB-like acyl-CoA transferase
MKPLADLSVVSFTHAASGPYAGRLLSEWGADLVKIEPPDGAFERNSAKHHHYLSNRGKRSLSVDLKTEEGRETVYDLIERADILLESYRPGVMEKLGLDYETVSARNPELVYCSISGFGESGPYRDRPAYDPIAQALSGVMHMTGEPDRKPSRVGAPLIDLGTATNAVLSIMMAIHERERTGEGQHVEASLHETAYGWGGMWSVFYTLHGEVPGRMGDKIGSYAPVGAYETSDGDVYMSALGDPTWEKLARSLDLEELLTDERFAESDSRRENREELDRLIEAETATYTTAELVEHMLEHNVPIAEIKSVPEVLEDEHLQERGMILDAETEDGESLKAPDVPMKLGSAEPARGTRPPALGEHSIEVLEAMGYPSERIQELIDSGAVVAEE